MNSGTKSGTFPARIQAGKIENVNPAQSTCTVSVDLGDRNVYFDALLANPYLHSLQGAGILAFPERGAQVWVARDSDKTDKAFIIGYRSLVDQDGSYVGGTSSPYPMSPGDMRMVAPLKNGLYVNRDGSVEIRGISPLCFVALEATGKQIRTHAMNYLMETPGSSFAFTTQPPEEDEDYVEACQYVTKVRAFADEKYAAVEIHVGGALTELYGDIEDNKPVTVEDPVYRLLVREDNEESVVKAQIVADRTGRIGIEPQDVRIALNDNTGDMVIYEQDEAAAEKFILGDTFISDLSNAMTQLKAALFSVGISLPGLDTLVSNLTSSVAGNAPYLTPRLKVE
jgi:hypothetical protein